MAKNSHNANTVQVDQVESIDFFVFRMLLLIFSVRFVCFLLLGDDESEFRTQKFSVV